MSQGEYQLGHDPAELDRLNEQGGLLAPATTMLLQAAGIRPGMRVLDLGSGSGDHTFAVAGWSARTVRWPAWNGPRRR